VFYMNPGLHTSRKRGINRISNNLTVLNSVDPRGLINGRPVFYFSSPNHVDLIPRYNPSLVVFDCLDEPSEEFENLAPYLRRALTAADLVIASSQKLYNDCISINSNTILIPNGCDFNHFAQAQNRTLPVPAELSSMQSPIIGYHGAIASWLNFNLITRLADSFPHGNVLMLGPMYNVTSVPRRSNLHWLGFKEFNTLPNYTQMFDAGIIPFRISSMTEAVNPIKMWEYMAAGIPVVTSALPEARAVEGVYFSHNDDEFIANVRQAINENNWHLKSARIAQARENTWLARAQKILGAMEKTLSKVPGINQASRSRVVINQFILPEVTSVRRRRRIVFDMSQGLHSILTRRNGASRFYRPAPVANTITITVKKPLVIAV